MKSASWSVVLMCGGICCSSISRWSRLPYPLSYAKLAGLVVSFRFGTVAGGGGGRGGRKKLSAVPGLEGGLLVMFGCFSDLLFLRKNGILADLNFFGNVLLEDSCGIEYC